MHCVTATSLLGTLVGQFISIHPDVRSYFTNVRFESTVATLDQSHHNSIKKGLMFVTCNLHGVSYSLARRCDDVKLSVKMVMSSSGCPSLPSPVRAIMIADHSALVIVLVTPMLSVLIRVVVLSSAK